MNGGSTLTVGGEFDGIGMLALGLHLAGLRHAWLCEVDPWRRSILELRFPGTPVFDDVRAVGAATARPVDVIAGGFPCKGVSSAGGGAGFGHPETVLWREMLRTIRELRPRYVLVENVANLLRLRPPGGQPGDLFREVLAGLSECGFDVVWDVLPAAAIGAPHLRERVFAVASHPGRQPDRADAGAAHGDAEGDGPKFGDGLGGRGQAATHPDGADQLRVGGQRGEQGGRSDVGGERQAAADPGRRPAQLRGVGRELHGAAGEAEGDRDQRQRGRDAAADRAQAAADADDGRQPQQPQRDGERRRGFDGPLGHDLERPDPRLGRGVAVEWGKYGPAVERWQRIFGPAPEPLVRRVDDGATRRVERSERGVERRRLSALGDGVQVQIGYLAGCHILDLERERVAA